MTLTRFARGLWWLVRHRLVSRWNIRAAWIAAHGNPMPAAASFECTDEEWERWMDAIS